MVERSKKPSAIPVSPSAPAPHVDFSHDNSRVTATLPTGESIEVLLFGAHVISWKSGGRENLFLSEKAHLDGSKAVRGGIPLVFPVFGPPPRSGSISSLPQHGFARTSRWEFLNKSTSEATTTTSADGPSTTSATSRAVQDNNVKLDFGLSSTNLSAEAKKAWPFNFGIIYSITLTKNALETSMCVRNEGTESFEFQVLFHTYFRVKDIAQTTLANLSNITYLDKTVNPPKSLKESHAALPFTSETDRVYGALPANTVLTVSEGGKPSFEIVRDNLEDVVVWNPWTQKAAGMSDFGPREGWKEMLCVEAGAVRVWQKLDGEETFEGGQIIKAVP